MVGQTCRFAQISPPASAAMLAEPWVYAPKRNFSLSPRRRSGVRGYRETCLLTPALSSFGGGEGVGAESCRCGCQNAPMRSEERRVGKSVDLGGRRITKKRVKVT